MRSALLTCALWLGRALTLLLPIGVVVLLSGGPRRIAAYLAGSELTLEDQ